MENETEEPVDPPQHVHAVQIVIEPSNSDQNDVDTTQTERLPPQTEEKCDLEEINMSKSKSDPLSEPIPPPAKHKRKKSRKPIFISYSPEGGFLERQFVCETVRQLKENNLAADVWFDRDEQNLTSVTWLSQRMEAAEKCHAAVCILSKECLRSWTTLYELRILAERQTFHDPPKVFMVFLEELELPKQFLALSNDCVDLAIPAARELSVPEKATLAVGSLIAKVELFAVVCATYEPLIHEDNFTDHYKKRSLCYWTVNDLQSWLFDLGVREFYRQNFAELFVDGFVMMSMADQDLEAHLGIDNKAVRKKLLREVVTIQEKERQQSENWHLLVRSAQRPKPDRVYVIYDPADVRLSRNLKRDLKAKGFVTMSHDKLGQSKVEFLQLNGPVLASCKNAVILLTEGASTSPFVFHEVLFADWLGKSVISLLFKNVWSKLKPSLKAVLGERMAVDFETKMYSESIDVLEHHLKPLKIIPGVVLEQSYLNRMEEGLRPLSVITSATERYSHPGDIAEPRVYISYQWDAQNKVAEIRRILEGNSIPCFADSSSTISQTQRGNFSTTQHGSRNPIDRSASNNDLQFHLQRNMKFSAIVVCIVTPRYLQCDSCVKDVILADSLNKPIVPVLLRFVSWPPEVTTPSLKKILAQTSTIDFSNDKLFQQNIPALIERLRKYLRKEGKK